MNTKKILIFISIFILIILGIWWSKGLFERSDIAERKDKILSRAGLHWHSELFIYVKGERLAIPEGIGLGAVHQPIHTHDDSDRGIVHMEFSGFVRESDTTLGQFFKNWGKDMRSFGTNMKMMVNGKENTEYGEYHMRDNDKIELWYQ